METAGSGIIEAWDFYDEEQFEDAAVARGFERGLARSVFNLLMRNRAHIRGPNGFVEWDAIPLSEQFGHMITNYEGKREPVLVSANVRARMGSVPHIPTMGTRRFAVVQALVLGQVQPPQPPLS